MTARERPSAHLGCVAWCGSSNGYLRQKRSRRNVPRKGSFEVEADGGQLPGHITPLARFNVSHSASVLIPLIAGLPKNVGGHSHRGMGIIVGASRRRCPHPIALAEQTSLQLV
jgi:hypothetical protein